MTMITNDNKELNQLARQINKTMDLPSFAEKITGKSVSWRRSGYSAVMNCPFSWHDDKNASLHMNLMESGIWVYHCFGCHSKGTALQFYLDYNCEENFEKAVINICNQFKISLNGAELAFSYTNNIVDRKQKLETENILVSNQCRELLNINFKKHQQWVAKAYQRLNIALDMCDQDEVEKIGHEASERVRI